MSKCDFDSYCCVFEAVFGMSKVFLAFFENAMNKFFLLDSLSIQNFTFYISNSHSDTEQQVNYKFESLNHDGPGNPHSNF